MKLLELLNDYFKDELIASQKGFTELFVPNTKLKYLKNHILECDEFKNVTELILTDLPTFLKKDNTPAASATYVIRPTNEISFEGECYIYRVGLSVPQFDTDSIVTQQKSKNITVSPIDFDPIHFSPYRIISFKVNEEALADEEAIKNSFYRESIHKNLDSVLNNMKPYEIEGTRYPILRGLFNTLSNTKLKINE